MLSILDFFEAPSVFIRKSGMYYLSRSLHLKSLLPRSSTVAMVRGPGQNKWQFRSKGIQAAYRRTKWQTWSREVRGGPQPRNDNEQHVAIQ